MPRTVASTAMTVNTLFKFKERAAAARQALSPQPSGDLSCDSSPSVLTARSRSGRTKRLQTKKGHQRPAALQETLGEKAREGLWECRMHQSRRWGRSLESVGGSDGALAKKLCKTMRDSRALSELALRRTALEALVPAAAVGHSEALAVQADALGDPAEVVRNTAIRALRSAAGGRRAEPGSAVSLVLKSSLPHRRTLWDVDAKHACADAIRQLAPRGDEHGRKVVRKWLKDDVPVVRREAVRALGTIGGGAADVEAVGAVLLNDSQWQVKSAAVEALTQLGIVETKPPTSSSGGRRTPNKTVTKSSLQRVSVAGTGRRTSSDSAAARRTSVSSTTSAASSKGSRSVVPSLRTSPVLPQRPETDKDHALIQLARACVGEADLRGAVLVDAVAALGRVSRGHIGARSHGLAVEGAASGLASSDANVRKAAVMSMQDLAVHDASLVQRVAAGTLENTDWRVRGSAAEVMTTAPPEGLQHVVDGYNLAAACLEAPTWAGRRSAPTALGQLAARGTADTFDKALAALVPRLGHSDWSIRRKAAQALIEVLKVNEGSNSSVRFVKGYLKDPEEEVRKVVAMALPWAAPRKSKTAIGLAGQVCNDVDPEVRLAGMEVLSLLAAPDRSRSRKAVAICVRCVQSDDDDLRAATIRTLTEIASGRRTAIDSLVEVFSHRSEKVRLSASQAVAAVGKGRFERAERRVMPLLRHRSGIVRQAATDCMARLYGQETNVDGCIAIQAASLSVGHWRRRFDFPRGALLPPEVPEESVTRGRTPRSPSPPGPSDLVTASSSLLTVRGPRPSSRISTADSPAGGRPSPSPPSRRQSVSGASPSADLGKSLQIPDLARAATDTRDASQKEDDETSSPLTSARTAQSGMEKRRGSTGGKRRRKKKKSSSPEARRASSGILQALLKGDMTHALDALSGIDLRRRQHEEEDSDEEVFSESGTDVDDIIDLPEDLIAASLKRA